MKNDEKSGTSAEVGAFPSTQWSVVLCAANDGDSQAHQALEQLCARYWYPLYHYARRLGRTHHDAEDCTQEFIARLLASRAVERARPERGRFRGFLLSGMRNFLINEWARASAAKRGGGAVPLSLDFTTADHRFSIEPVDSRLTPEQSFDRAWAQDMIARVLASIRREYAQRSAGALFDALEPFVLGQRPIEGMSAVAAGLGMNAHALTVALHRVRSRLGRRLRDEVANTVGSEADVDDELRYLIAAISSREGA